MIAKYLCQPIPRQAVGYQLIREMDLRQSQIFPLPALSRWERVAEGQVRGETPEHGKHSPIIN
jgi:hypothetical protein